MYAYAFNTTVALHVTCIIKKMERKKKYMSKDPLECVLLEENRPTS